MTKLKSVYRPLITISLPVPIGRQHYMHSFDLSDPTVPKGLEDYLEPIKQLLKAAGANVGEAHVTIDEKLVKAGASQRKPKPHVDGCFVKVTKSVIPSGAYWSHESSGSGDGSGWLHHCNNIGVGELRRMPVIVAASAPGCKVWAGEFDGVPKSDGDLSHIADQLGTGIIVPANVGYLLSPDCIHESMIMEKDTPRTFLRIALPNNVEYAYV